MIYIIGAGGVGSWLTPAICLLKSPNEVIVVDGDTLEHKNLNRQLFTEEDIGKPKAQALADKYGCVAAPCGYYSHGSIHINSQDWLLVGVDNNPARKAVLESCDVYGCKAIFGANEVTSAEAYYYDPKWTGSPMDPLVYYPEISTDTSDDPRHAAIGCTGEAQKNNRQLVSANFMAAALMQHLFVLWNMERNKFNREAQAHLPYRIRQNMSSYEVMKQINHTKTNE